jgi:hypothetical protein
MPIATGAGHEMFVAALFAAVTVTAQLRSATALEGVEDFPVMGRVFGFLLGQGHL